MSTSAPGTTSQRDPDSSPSAASGACPGPAAPALGRRASLRRLATARERLATQSRNIERAELNYTHAEARRLSVKPGLTGIWQVSGRSDVPFRRWMAMDRAYLRKRSLAFDLALLARTPWTVVTMRGAR